MIDVPIINALVSLNDKVPVFNPIHRRYDYLKFVDVAKYTLTKDQLKRDCAYANKILEFDEVKLCPSFCAVIHGAFIDYYIAEDDADYYLLKRRFQGSGGDGGNDKNHSRLYYTGTDTGIYIVDDHHEAHADVVECAMIEGEHQIEEGKLNGFVIEPFNGAEFKNWDNKFSIEGYLDVNYNEDENKFYISLSNLTDGEIGNIISSYITIHWKQFDEEFGFHIQSGTIFNNKN